MCVAHKTIGLNNRARGAAKIVYCICRMIQSELQSRPGFNPIGLLGTIKGNVNVFRKTGNDILMSSAL